jgi:sugar (pentulose or hexulose) kinase
LDYEHPIPSSVRQAYDSQRDPFVFTGSPALPDGLNLGAQLFFLESLHPGLFSGQRRIVPWAQYWSWLLSGVAASEVTSLGCHTDLWRPLARVPSQLATDRGWSEHLAPLHDAGAVLGTLRSEWAERTGLSSKVRVYCGLHDSNAALVAARASTKLSGQEATILSTGTWFVAMRTPAGRERVTRADLDEKRDCLVNVDVGSNPVPSARFMGGREIELLTGLDTRRIDIVPDQPALLASVADVVASQAMVLPTLAPGCGPFPHGRCRWISMPSDERHRRAAVALYAALVADVALELIGTREQLLIEGRFSESQVFVRALASLRPDVRVYVCHPRSDVAFGALSLTDPGRQSPAALVRVEPLEQDLREYRSRWRLEAERTEQPSA